MFSSTWGNIVDPVALAWEDDQIDIETLSLVPVGNKS